ncbi:MAG: hypothetical protein KZQ83_19585, partial [gamma proteobacterium symbiont of Taylorina sp.]|nr:hypothetical protein [gamma proteobacterium symbiont of Taylorina sp.]
LHKISVLKQKIQFELMHFQKQYGDIVIFGAGHRSIMFVNLLGISSYIRFVIDDDTNKLNLLLPGTDIKIINSTLLSQYKPKVCLLAVGLHIEEKIVQKLNQINSGIEHFFSISPDSQNALAIFSSSDT